MDLLKHPSLLEVKMLKIDVDGKSNFAAIFDCLANNYVEIPLFHTVETLKIYRLRNIGKDNKSLKNFFLAFKNLKCLKGVN